MSTDRTETDPVLLTIMRRLNRLENRDVENREYIVRLKEKVKDLERRADKHRHQVLKAGYGEYKTGSPDR